MIANPTASVPPASIPPAPGPAAPTRVTAGARQPAWGVGMSYRFVIHRQCMRSAAMIDYLEIPAEDYVNDDRRAEADPDESLVREAAAHFPVIGHGNHFSIGSAQAPDAGYADQVERFAARLPISEYSDHLAWTRVDQTLAEAFIAVPFTDLGVAAAVENTRRLQRRVGVPVLLENVTYHFAIPAAPMREEQFIRRVVEAADCGIMLDIANVFINAANQKYDPRQFISALPGERVGQAHFCGALQEHDGYYLDTHTEPTRTEIWSLLDHALAHTALRALTLERDDDFFPFTRVLDELWAAKELFLKHRPPRPPASFFLPAATAPAPDDTRASYSGELLLFQKVLMQMLMDEPLARAVDREGESALRHTRLGPDERRVLAAIPPIKRERLGRSIRGRYHEHTGGQRFKAARAAPTSRSA